MRKPADNPSSAKSLPTPKTIQEYELQGHGNDEKIREIFDKYGSDSEWELVKIILASGKALNNPEKFITADRIVQELATIGMKCDKTSDRVNAWKEAAKILGLTKETDSDTEQRDFKIKVEVEKPQDKESWD